MKVENIFIYLNWTSQQKIDRKPIYYYYYYLTANETKNKKREASSIYYD